VINPNAKEMSSTNAEHQLIMKFDVKRVTISTYREQVPSLNELCSTNQAEKLADEGRRHAFETLRLALQGMKRVFTSREIDLMLQTYQPYLHESLVFGDGTMLSVQAGPRHNSLSENDNINCYNIVEVLKENGEVRGMTPHALFEHAKLHGGIKSGTIPSLDFGRRAPKRDRDD